jgi:hypothetical protein
MARRLSGSTVSRFTLVVAVAVGACRATGTSPLVRASEDPDGGPNIILDGGGPEVPPPVADPHTLLAVDPPHGPFSGGTVALLRGNGFTSDVRVWFGETELPSEDVLALSPQRIQVTVPAGEAGAVDVTAQNGSDGSTRVTFKHGFTYDAFYADPPSGPTSVGTLIRLHGQGTHWDEQTRVTVDREPCELVEVVGPEELVCRAPSGTAGSRPIRVTTADGAVVDVLDAFTYGNTDNGFRGGFSGDPLEEELRVLVFDDLAGVALPDTTVIVGVDDPIVARTDENGVAIVRGDFRAPPTVTIARHCFQPTTFVDVPVDTLTAYLLPVLASTCIPPEGDIPGGGGNPGQGASVTGELVWRGLGEFRRDGWTNVPPPASENEQHVAYVFPLSPRATEPFDLPSAVTAVTPLADGDFGFRFHISTRPGNYTLYALAGVENRARTPAVFTAYSMGLIRGVSAAPGKTAENVFIGVDLPLDQALEMQIEGPEPTRRGPDRLEVSVAIRVGTEGYVLLPGTRASTLLGQATELSLVGLPPLERSLLGARYVAAARAVTGESGAAPRSVLGLVGATTTADPLLVGPFIEVPRLTTPATNARWDGRELSWTAAAGGLEPNLTILDVSTAAGLYDWRIIAPGENDSVRLPDLGAVDPDLAWPRGAQTVAIVRARVNDFEYGALRYRDLTERAWTAHATDAFFSSY